MTTSGEGVSSVPSESNQSKIGGGAAGGIRISTPAGSEAKHVDSILMYCSYFTYGKDQAMNRRFFCESIKASDIINKLNQMESKYNYRT